ncbi:MAG: nucleotide exchange factor GrpE [Proteobacteria bacterium]|nr:nucleotide exchange factor GrpE [Pseudomonadota bacterium]
MTRESKKDDIKEKESVEQEKTGQESASEQQEDENECISISKKEYEDLLNAKKAQQDLLYVCADFDNFRKRAAKDLQQQIDFANEKLIKAILPVLDNLHRATEKEALELDFASDHEIAKKSVIKFWDGIKLIQKQLEDVLDKFGVKEVKCLNEKFDPNFHEAMEHTESDKHSHGHVIKEYEKGYTLKDRLIRPSKVCVSKKTKKEEE